MSGTAAWAGIDLAGRCSGLRLERAAAVSVRRTAGRHLFVGPDAAQHGSVSRR